MQQTTAAGRETAQVRTLPNGIKVLLEPLPYLRTVTAGAWIKAGSGNEAAEVGGISHFLEHLFFKGTETRSAHDLMAAIERRGGHMNAFTSRDYTCIYLKTLDTHIASGIEILGDILKNSQFLDFEKERNVILEEISSIEDVPEDFIHDIYAERHWPEHPIGRPVTGTIETVSAITLEDVRRYYSEWYRPDNMLLAVVGNFEPEAVYRQIEEEFGSFPTLAVPGRPAAPRFGAGLEFVEQDISQDHVVFGFPGTTGENPDRYVYEMVSSILGGGSTSRLFEKVREEAGLAYSIYTFTSSYFSTGTLGVYAAVAPENINQAIDLCAEQLRDLRDVPVGEEELSLNREQLKGGVLMALESTSNRMSRLAKSTMYHGRVLSVDEILASIDAVTPEDVQRVAQKMFRRENATSIIMGPKDGRRVEDLPL
jgi:predicted Zn-dependent peptidase